MEVLSRMGVWFFFPISPLYFHLMPFSFGRYSSLLLLFFLHGLVYAILLFRKGMLNDRASDKWLSLFLLLCILYIAPWMLGFAGWYDGYNCLSCRNFLFYAPLQHTLLMGPVIYFYLRALFQPTLPLRRKDLLHFLPAALYLFWCAIVFVTDRLILKRYYLMDGVADPDFDEWYIGAGLISLLCYLILSIRYYRRYRRFVQQQFSFADAIMFRWVRNFLVAFLIYFVANLAVHLLGLFGIDLDYIDTWWYYLFFAVLLYYIAINGYANAVETRILFGLDRLSPQQTALLEGPAEIETEEAPTMPQAQPAGEKMEELEGWKEKVLQAVLGQKLYTNPELSLHQLAAHLQTNTTTLSKVINAGFGMNFNDFINYYRVEDVKEKLSAGRANEVTIMSLAYDAGFNSKATFNRAFKKVTGKNPKDFLEA
jgi:AraC-like DNA-binding protein